MNRFIFLALLLWPSLADAQLELNASLQQGYIHNIFKNPSTWEPSNGTDLDSDQLLQSGFITELGLEGDWTKKWKKQQLELDGGFTTQLSPTLSVANLLDLNLNQAYEYRISKRLRIYQEASIRSKNRQGNGVAEELFVLPNAYRQFGYNAGLYWTPNRQHLLKIEGGRSSKIYRPTETSALRYQATNARIYHRYKFQNTTYLTRWYNTLRYQSRWYERERFREQDDESIDEDIIDEVEDITIYPMRYATLNSTLKYELNEFWSISPSLEATRRGSTHVRLRYWQIRSAVKFEFEKKKWECKVRASFTYRKNSFLFPGDSIEPLLYRYGGLSADFAYALPKGWAFTLTGSTTKRWSNFEDISSRLNRSYQYGEFFLGIRRGF